MSQIAVVTEAVQAAGQRIQVLSSEIEQLMNLLAKAKASARQAVNGAAK